MMVSRYASGIFAMIVRIVDDTMDAEELTQDTFLRAFSHISSYDARRASLSTWLSRIAYHLTIDFLRRRSPVIASIEDTEEWQTDINDEQLEKEFSSGKEERIRQLEMLIDALPPDHSTYMYESRPFELPLNVETGQFIPLVLYGSYWYDADSEVDRFCGENFISPDLSSDIIKFIPHFYVIGIKIK